AHRDDLGRGPRSPLPRRRVLGSVAARGRQQPRALHRADAPQGADGAHNRQTQRRRRSAPRAREEPGVLPSGTGPRYSGTTEGGLMTTRSSLVALAVLTAVVVFGSAGVAAGQPAVTGPGTLAARPGATPRNVVFIL